MPEYVPGERLRVAVEGVVAPTPQSGETPTPGELTITLNTPSGPYDVTVPLDAIAVTVERLLPAGGEPQPGEVWQDATGVDRWAYRDSGGVSLLGGDESSSPWRVIHTDSLIGPITRVYQPAGQPGEAGEPVLTLGDRYRDRDGDIWTVAEEHGQLGLRLADDLYDWAEIARDYGPLTPITPAPAERTGEPRVMLGDLWEDGDGDIWKVVTNVVGEHRLTLGGSLYTWAEANADYEPLMLVQRAEYRRTTRAFHASQFYSGPVVSYPDWCDGAPVRLLTVQAITGGVRSEIEVTYQALGSDDGDIGTGTAARDAEVTVWEPTGGAS